MNSKVTNIDNTSFVKKTASVCICGIISIESVAIISKLKDLLSNTININCIFLKNPLLIPYWIIFLVIIVPSVPFILNILKSNDNDNLKIEKLIQEYTRLKRSK